MMFTCARCVIETFFTDVRKLMKHIVLYHANEHNFYYSCNLEKDGEDCCKICKSATAYKLHVYREHRNLISVSDSSQICGKICCPSCDTKVDTLLGLSAHYRMHCEMGQKVSCVVRDCHDEFLVYSSYTSHMSRLHKIDKLVKPQYFQPDSTDDEMDVDHGAESESMEYDVDDDVYKKHIAMLLLKLQEQCMLPSSTVQIVFDSLKDLIALIVEKMEENITLLCKQNNVVPELSAQLVLSARHGLIQQAIDELSTEWKRKQYYKEKFNYVEPISVHFDKTNPLITDSFQYVPLLNSLQVMLKNTEVLSEVMKASDHKAQLISSFSDGIIFSQHPVFQAHPTVLQLVIYSDEFDVVNPIGVHATVHKMLAFYYTLENISVHLRSKRDMIQLLALCNSSDVKKFGLKAVADVISKDVKQLEDCGIEVSGKKLYGSIAYIAGDNLNSYLIGGFNASFGPKVLHPCRFCMISNSELQHVIECDQLQYRTCESYNEQVALVTLDASQKTTFGIRYESPFNQGTFHVIDRLPPDIMHDLLEGVVPFEMALVLQQLLKDGHFTLQQLNFIIATWSYGPLDKQNKPVALALGEKIRQNAGRMWCLFRLLPLMIGSLIPKDNVFWCFFLELKDIVELVFAHRLSVAHTYSLTLKIQDHLATFLDLFPSRKLLPKHHFMLHYPRLISMLGPLRLAWCMRFESKHCYFTKLGKTVNNFKCLSSTFAVRHQLKQAYCSAATDICKEEVVLSRTAVVEVHNLAKPTSEQLVKCGIAVNQTFLQCRFVKINDMFYYKNMFVVIGCKNGLLVFGQIRNILVQGLIVRFFLLVFTSYFCTHMSAFALQPTSDSVMMKCEQFADYYPLTAYVIDGTKYVVLKNAVFDIEEYADL